MQVQSIQTFQSRIQDYIAQLGPKKVTAIALNVIGAIALAASAILAPIATTVTTALLIGGASLFVTGFFLNFFTHVESHEAAKGYWSTDTKDVEIGKSLDIVLRFGGKPEDMSASFNADHKIVINWNETQERVIEFNEIPLMINLVDKNSQFFYEKVSPEEWLKNFKKVEVVGFTINKDTTRIQLAFA